MDESTNTEATESDATATQSTEQAASTANAAAQSAQTGAATGQTQNTASAPSQADLDAANTERAAMKTRADAADAELRRYRVKDAFGAAVADTKSGIRNPKAVQAMLNTDRITFEKNDKGAEIVKGLSEELARIKGEFPEFFYASHSNADAGAGTGTAGAPAKLDGNAWLHNALTGR